jgi:mRNA-degrading endonuclease RelE of RelBE toxin-antitoxin system
MKRRVVIRWTDTVKAQLAKLPLKVRRGLFEKADQLAKADDPRKVYKPLVGPLEGYYRIPFSRYRAVFRIDEEKTAKGKIVLVVTITFVATGVPKSGDKHDVYRLAEKLVDWERRFDQKSDDEKD